MKKELRISEVAELFDVPISTLRYWEREGLIEFKREEDNNYRVASLLTIRMLCDITFYRKLAVPVDWLKKLHRKNYGEIEEVLYQSKDKLEKAMSEIQRVMESIEVKLEQIEKVKNMREETAEFVTEALPAVRHFDLYERSDLKNLIEFEKKLIVMVPYENNQEYHYGVFVPEPYTGGNLVRKKDNEPRTYLKVLMRTAYNRIENNNLSYYYDYLERHGYEPGLAMGRVLVSSNDSQKEGELCNYYETWIEAKKR